MEYSNEELGLIYVHKIGYNTKDQGLYEFIFSHDIGNIKEEGWNWDMSPACDNAIPPTEDYFDKLISLKTDSFDLECLCESVDRPYIHGYHTIIALAYEVMKEDENGYSEYDKLMAANLPLLVFHYGMTLDQVTDIFKQRNVVLRKNEFIEVDAIEF